MNFLKKLPVLKIVIVAILGFNLSVLNSEEKELQSLCVQVTQIQEAIGAIIQ